MSSPPTSSPLSPPPSINYESEAERVKYFTEESSGIKLPNSPELMTKEEVSFLIKMVIDEMLELYATVEDPESAKDTMINMIKEAKSIPKVSGTEQELIGEQADACVDCNYYMLNAMAKKGINLSKIFDLVHNANMDKRDLETKQFIKRSDGKILKRSGWQPPNITEEIVRQQKEGPW